MGALFFYFMAVLFALAVIVNEDFVFVLLYLFLGVYLASRWWGRRALQGVTARRKFERRAFLGERVNVELVIENKTWLPLAWLQMRESLPVGVHSHGPFQQVASLGSKASRTYDYQLECKRRGYYPIGPLDLFSGDVLGAAPRRQYRLAPDFLTVYPKIVPLTDVHLPSHAPLGTLRHHQPIFEDPSRVRGKREYVAGDSLRRVDWKATAAAGRLQVKLLEPSIALESAIFLDLEEEAYGLWGRFDVAELAIVTAASLANWIIGVRQSVGLVTNGGDPFGANQTPPPLPPRRGRGHLLYILETLARVQVNDGIPIAGLLREHIHQLSWGTSLIVITPRLSDELFDALFQARRLGMDALLVQCGTSENFKENQRKAAYFGFDLQQVIDENDLDVWRR
jgi:uncharacterized protein (DUF58 family)